MVDLLLTCIGNFFQKELSKQQRRLEEQNEAQKSMYKRMFGNPKDKEGKPEINKKSWVSLYRHRRSIVAPVLWLLTLILTHFE